MIGLFNNIKAAFGRLAAAIRRYPQYVLEETVRLLRSRGLPSLRAAVPVVSGRLRDSFRVRVRGNVVQVGSVDPAAQYIRYREPGRYGARTPEGTLRAWARAEMPRIIGQAVRIAQSRIRGSR